MFSLQEAVLKLQTDSAACGRMIVAQGCIVAVFSKPSEGIGTTPSSPTRPQMLVLPP